MGYKVRYFMGGRESGSERIAELETAREIVDTTVASGTIEAAEVVDADGRVVFRRPRTVRPA